MALCILCYTCFPRQGCSLRAAYPSRCPRIPSTPDLKALNRGPLGGVNYTRIYQNTCTCPSRAVPSLAVGPQELGRCRPGGVLPTVGIPSCAVDVVLLAVLMISVRTYNNSNDSRNNDDDKYNKHNNNNNSNYDDSGWMIIQDESQQY